MDFKKITTFVFDVDGVFTDNKILITEQGELLRSMHVRDGLALKIALSHNYKIAIITGGSSTGVVSRFTNFGIQDIYTGVHNKQPCFESLRTKYGLKKEEILYMGDDLIDIPVFSLAGISVTPADAIPEAQAASGYTTSLPGGQGCVREIIEKTLREKNDWVLMNH